MTMTSAVASPTTVNARDIGDSESPSQVLANVRAATPSSIRAILLADGWHTVKNAQLVQFAIGEAHSPITPTSLYPYLVFEDEGREVYTPMSQILGFDLSKSGAPKK